MKKYKMMACLLALCGLLTACSMDDDADMAKDAVENKANDVKQDVDDSIDNVMGYFKEKGITYENDAKIDKMDFAAYEGKTFDYKGSKAYLYRVKSNDDNMKKVMKEASDKGKVKVSINNKEQEYAAKVNGNYLLLYDMNADMTEVVNAFPNYQMKAKSNTDEGQTSNAKKSADDIEQDTVD